MEQILKMACIRRLLVLLTTISLLLYAILLRFTSISHIQQYSLVKENDMIDFCKADNITGFPYEIVPNIIHFIKFRSRKLKFYEMLCMLSAVRNHGPDELIIHNDKGQIHGKYWDMLLEHSKGSRTNIRVNKYEEPPHIFGKKFSCVQHASDVARLRILMEYGGIYLDTDVYVVRPLRQFLHFEYTIGWDEGKFLGTQVQFAHKNARFLQLYLDTYHQYNASLWYYNAGELPTTSVLMKNPSLVHRVKLLFGVHMLIRKLYKTTWSEWRNQFTIHLLIKHRSYLDKKSPIKKFDESNIKTYNYTFGQMARQLLHNTTDLIK